MWWLKSGFSTAVGVLAASGHLLFIVMATGNIVAILNIIGSLTWPVDRPRQRHRRGQTPAAIIKYS